MIIKTKYPIASVKCSDNLVPLLQNYEKFVLIGLYDL